MQTSIVISFLLSFASIGLAASAPPSPFFGLNAVGFFHYRDDPDAVQKAQAKMAWVKQAGAKADRFDFWWGEIEPQPGKFKWDKADWLVNFYAQQHVAMLPILCYRANWMSEPPHTDEEFRAFATYTQQAVSRYRGRIESWEIWNEPNIPTFWKPPNPRDYAKLLMAAHAAAKQVDPNCTVVGAAANETDVNFILDLGKFGAAKSMDALSFHPYSMADGPEEMYLARQIRNMRWAAAKIGRADLPLWITEMGWVADVNNPREVADQCKFLVQSHVIALAEGIARMFWFNLQDWREGDKLEGWGMFTADAKPKPALRVYRHMVNTLDGARFLGYLPTPNAIVAAFERNNRTLLVAWANRGQKAILDLVDAADVTNINGGVVRLTGKAIELTADPLYISFKTKPQLANLVAHLPEPENLLVNPSAEEFSGDNIYGWHKGVFYGGGDKGTFFIAAQAADGERALGLKSCEDAMWQSLPIPAVPGEKYTLSAKIKTTDAEGENSVQILYLSGPGWGWKGGPMTKTVTGTNEWRTVTVSGMVPEDADVVRVNCVSKSNKGIVLFDDLKLMRPSEPEER